MNPSINPRTNSKKKFGVKPTADLKTMKNVLLNTALKLSVVASLGVFSGAALAEYRVSAIDRGLGFKSLLAGDVKKAQAILQRRHTESMDYADRNNLCVLKILKNQVEEAVESCNGALIVLRRQGLRLGQEKVAAAEIYSNLSVAQLLLNNEEGAEASLLKALELSEGSNNAQANLQTLRAFPLALN